MSMVFSKKFYFKGMRLMSHWPIQIHGQIGTVVIYKETVKKGQKDASKKSSP